MNTKSRWIAFGAAAFAALVLVFLLGRWTGGGEMAGFDHSHNQTEPVTAAGETGAETVWTCSMHPQVRQPEPGQCPLCGMALIKAAADDDSGDDSDLPRLSVSPRSAALMNIQTWPARKMPIKLNKPFLGRILYDQSRTFDVVVRTDSYIERLFTNYTGAPVREGDHLAELYSPDIFAAAEDLLIAARMGENGDAAFSRDARQRLRLLGVSDQEIDRILESGEAPRTFTVFSPYSGIINEMGGHQGHWLSEGEHLVEIVDNSSMWVWVDVYERDMPFIRHGQPMRFTVKSLPGREFHGAVAFVPPNIDRQARAFRVRLNVPNPDGALRDGMFVRAILDASIDSRGGAIPPDMEGQWISPMHPEIVKDGPGPCDICGMDMVSAEEFGLVSGDYEQPLVIPASAPLITGRRAVVYVKIPDMDRPTFELRQVELGPRADDYYVVYSGLEENDQVVTHGGFKIDAELQLRGRPSMMAPEGGAPPVHGHGDQRSQMASDPRDEPVREGFAAEAVDSGFAGEVALLVQEYLEVAGALAADDLDGTQQGVGKLHGRLEEIGQHRLAGGAHVAWMERYESLDTLLREVKSGSELEAFRKVFQDLTRQIEHIHLNFGGDQSRVLHRAYCPMAHNDRGATWLQADKEINNPYFGASMLRCGEILGEMPRR